MKKQDFTNNFTLFKPVQMNEKEFIKRNFYNNYFKSPLNYTGGKYKLLPQIMKLLPSKINTFVDFFCGGGDMCLNIDAEKIIAIDILTPLINLHSTFKKYNFKDIDIKMIQIIEKFNLENNTSNSRDDMKIKFNALRDYYNTAEESDEKSIILYILIMCSYAHMMRFNNKNEFNMTYGNKFSYNSEFKNKIQSYMEQLNKKNIIFCNMDYKLFNVDTLKENDFCYFDPPYLITDASYNRSWTIDDEKNLYDFINKISSRNIKFAFSNVLISRGEKNELLEQWVEKNNYSMYELYTDYNNSIRPNKNKEQQTQEVLIVNY